MSKAAHTAGPLKVVALREGFYIKAGGGPLIASMTSSAAPGDARLFAAAPDLLWIAQAALEWIDAIPADVVAKLPAMPGFDRDAADAALSRATGEA